MKIDNLQAFSEVSYDFERGQAVTTSSEGMTLLDYFAAKAMQGFYSCESTIALEAEIARYSYEMAKAMLIERKKVMEELQNDNS